MRRAVMALAMGAIYAAGASAGSACIIGDLSELGAGGDGGTAGTGSGTGGAPERDASGGARATGGRGGMAGALAGAPNDGGALSDSGRSDSASVATTTAGAGGAGGAGAGGNSGAGGAAGQGGASGSSSDGGGNAGTGGSGGSVDAGGALDTGLCVSENDATFCTRSEMQCGQATSADNCGRIRTVKDCGACARPKLCGAAGHPNTCEFYAGTPFGGKAPMLGVSAGSSSTLEAENFDVGGEGISYHDTTADNEFDAYRPNDGVDIETACGGNSCYDIADIAAGEWTKYTVNVATAALYSVQIDGASAFPRRMHIEVDGINLTGPLIVDTGSASTFRPIDTTVTFWISTGLHVITFVFDDESMALNWVKFRRL